MEIQEFRSCLGENIKRLRKLRHLTQSELAESIGIETHNLNRIENGKSFPQAKTIVSIINYFDIKPYELFVIDNDKLGLIVEILLRNPERIEDFYGIARVLGKEI